MGPELIAETDDDGRVVWVWIMEPGTRHPRPIRDLAAGRQLLNGTNCHGASFAAVEQWFDAREQAGAAQRHC